MDTDILYRAHAPFVCQFLRRMGAPDQDVADLVQEVFLVAHRRGGFLPAGAKPTTWLAEIGVRVAAEHHRQRRRSREDPDTARVELASAPGLVAEQYAARHALRRAQQELETLGPARAATFLLFQIGGSSCGEIAEQLHVPVGTVHSRVHYARREFMKRKREWLSVG